MRARFFVLLLMAISLSAYVVFFEMGRDGAPKSGGPARIVDFEDSEVKEIKVFFRGGPEIHLGREADEWRLQDGFDGAFSPAEMATAAMGVFRYGWIEILDAEDSSDTVFGLEEPEVVLDLSFYGPRGATRKTLLLGDDNPAHRSCYARLEGDPRIYLVGILYKRDLEDLIRTAR